MEKIIRATLFAIAFLLSVLAFIDIFLLRYSVDSIYAGQRFVYWSHVEQTPRAWLALGLLVFVALWLFLRKIFKPLAWINGKTMLLLLIAGSLFTIVAPLASLGNIARHIQTLSINEYHYQTYFQYASFAALDCDYVLVRCDSLGLVCEYRGHWQIAPLCLGANAPIELEEVGEGIVLKIHGEIVFEE